MKPLDFEGYLREQHAKDYHGTDDDMPDAFDAWLADLRVDDLIRYANLAIHQAQIGGIQRGGEIALATLKETQACAIKS